MVDVPPGTGSGILQLDERLEFLDFGPKDRRRGPCCWSVMSHRRRRFHGFQGVPSSTHHHFSGRTAEGNGGFPLVQVSVLASLALDAGDVGEPLFPGIRPDHPGFLAIPALELEFEHGGSLVRFVRLEFAGVEPGPLPDGLPAAEADRLLRELEPDDPVFQPLVVPYVQLFLLVPAESRSAVSGLRFGFRGVPVAGYPLVVPALEVFRGQVVPIALGRRQRRHGTECFASEFAALRHKLCRYLLCRSVPSLAMPWMF